MLETIMRASRFAVRSLLSTPGFTVTVVATLALCIGATTAVFAIVNAVLLRPLPFPDSEQLMQIRQSQGTSPDASISPARLEDWSRSESAFAVITGYYSEDVSDTTSEIPQTIRRASVAPRFSELWGVAPVLGHGFTKEDYDRKDVALISDRYWRMRFAGQRDALGGYIRIGERRFTVVGVMPADFMFPDRAVDIWTPVAFDSHTLPRSAAWYTGIGRLKPGMNATQGQASLEVIQAHLARQFPETDGEVSIQITPLRDAVVGDAGRSIWLIFGSVFVLLLIACSNLTSLLLSRATEKDIEVALRFALGASRMSTLTTLAAEIVLLTASGAMIAVLVSAGIVACFKSLVPGIPRVDEITVDWSVAGFALGLALVVALLAGLLPLLRGSTSAVSLRSVRAEVSSKNVLRWTLVGVQVGLAVTLLSVAALLLRSFDNMARVNTGYTPGQILAFQVSGSWKETGDYERLLHRINLMLDELGRLPNVVAASSSNLVPGVGNRSQTEFEITEIGAARRNPIVAESRVVSHGYFDTLQIPLLQGERCRLATSARESRTSPEVMVNRSFVQRYLPDRRAVGLHISGGFGTAAGRVVGVVGDVRDIGIDVEPAPTVYSCFSAPNPTPIILLRVKGDPYALVDVVRRKVKEIEPLRAVFNVGTVRDKMDEAFAQSKFRTTLITTFAVAALLMACLGIYGMLNYAMSLRQREVGLMLALGAGRGQIVLKFLKEVGWVVLAAVISGLILLVGIKGLLASLLFGIEPTDPLTLTGVALLIGAVAIVAAVVPVARAVALDPMQTLREQ